MSHCRATGREIYWTDAQCKAAIVHLRSSHAEEKVNTSEVYALAANPKFLPTRRKKTCGDLLPGVFLTSTPSSSTGPKEFGRAECDAQILAYAYFASCMRWADPGSTKKTPLDGYVQGIFQLRWTYQDFCKFARIAATA